MTGIPVPIVDNEFFNYLEMDGKEGEWFALPLQGRRERAELYSWVEQEEEYVAGKFDQARREHDEAMSSSDTFNDFWARQIIQYIDRAFLFFREAEQAVEDSGRVTDAQAVILRKKAQQALAKGMMTFKGAVESSIRVYGVMPKGGVPSGEVEPN